ncbi:alpha/beta hydrolase [Caulobacter sp. BP25]|uniref:alpha/beta hydrolase n=1 Tax=Caulobacter sp. BP25 TaxID=2048900 RepID=UPI0013747D5D|nr:alpha/beta hydrolase [Caulobacter sp. BP25]
MGDRNVHYRTAGAGPVLVLLHDSPRSSSLHAPLLEAFSDRYEVIALDTPGYGESDPLPGKPSIADFAEALGDALEALGVGRAIFYGFHTSSKILLELAVSAPDRVALAVLDGLSIPVRAPDEAFIASYMRPFTLDGEGAWLAREWTRVLDTWRWFPWFHQAQSARMPIDQPSIAQMHAYALDYFLAGPTYVSAYEAAMRHDPSRNLRRVKAPIVVMAREDDVLHAHLARIPADRSTSIVARSAPADTRRWLEILKTLFAQPTGEARSEGPPARGGRFYVDTPAGQVHVRSFGADAGRPILYLHDLPGGAGGEGRWLEDLAARRPVLAIDLPGCGCSDPVEHAAFEGHVAWLEDVLGALQLAPADIVADGASCAFALGLAAQRPDLVAALVADGAPLVSPDLRARWLVETDAALEPERSGAHWLRAWHLLRDREAQYPWWDGSAAAIRHREPDIRPERLRQSTLDMLRQPGTWSTALRAALDVDLNDIAPKVGSRVLFPSDPGDPRQAGGEILASRTPRGTLAPRAASTEARAAQYSDFLAAEDL